MPIVARNVGNSTGAKGHYFKNVFEEGKCVMIEENLQNDSHRPKLSDDERVRDFQRKLYRKAKQEKKTANA